MFETVKAWKLSYYGHTVRKQGSCVEKEIMQGTMPGARRRGRPRTALMDNIKTRTGLSVEESVRMTEDRDKWRKYGCLGNSSRCVVGWVGRIGAGWADGDRRRHGSAEGGHRPGPRGERATEDAARPARITRRQTADQCTIRYDTIRQCLF